MPELADPVGAVSQVVRAPGRRLGADRTQEKPSHLRSMVQPGPTVLQIKRPEAHEDVALMVEDLSSSTGQDERERTLPAKALPTLKHRPKGDLEEWILEEKDAPREREPDSFELFMVAAIEQSFAAPQRVALPPRRDGRPATVKQIECGSMHSLVLTDEGDVYGFGDNSRGQIQSIHNDSILAAYVYRKPKRVTCIQHLLPGASGPEPAKAPLGASVTLYADGRQSALRLCGQERDAGRFYGWGTRNMIDSVSKGAQIQGADSDRHRSGAYARGGSSTQKGVSLMEHAGDGRKPYLLCLGHGNTAVLAEHSADALQE